MHFQVNGPHHVGELRPFVLVHNIYFHINILGSEATSLFDVRRWTFDVGRSFSYKYLLQTIRPPISDL